MSSSPKTLDLFAREDARTEAPERGLSGIEGRGEPVQAENEGSGPDARKKADVSIEAFARRQADLRNAGIASATAYWKARGITWPR